MNINRFLTFIFPSHTHVLSHVRLTPLAFPALLILLGFLGATHILTRTSTYGAALTGDSITYLSTARSVLAGEGIYTFTGISLDRWPPFFPLFLAFIGLFGIDPLDAGHLVNIAIFGLIISISGFWLNKKFTSRLLVLGATVTIMTSFPLSHISSYFMTEALFILFALLALMQIESFVRQGRNTARQPFVLSAIFAALAAVTRYVGISVIFSAILIILIRKNIPIYTRLKYAVSYAAISSVPLAAVLIHNYIIFRVLTRQQQQLLLLPSDVLTQVLTILTEIFTEFDIWIFPRKFLRSGPLNIPWMLVGLVVLGILVFFIMSRRSQDTKLTGSPSPVIPFAIFTLVYLTCYISARTGISLSPSHTRFLAPLYIPLLFIAVFLLNRLLHHDARGKMVTFKWILVSLVLLGWLTHIGLTVEKGLYDTARSLTSGYEGNTYNTTYWDDSETVAYLKANPIDGQIYSNDPAALYILAAVTPPVKWAESDSPCPSSWYRYQDFDATYIVWIDRQEYRYPDFYMQNLKAQCSLKPVAELSDGSIYYYTDNQ